MTLMWNCARSAIVLEESTKATWGLALLKSGVAISKKCSPQTAREKMKISRSYERVKQSG